MTTATEVNENTIIGQALYLELTPTQGDLGRVTQILISPEGIDHNDKYVRMAFHSRTISTSSPRKQWRINFTDVSNEELLRSGVPANREFSQEQAVKMISRFEASLIKQISYKFVVRNKPIVVEVSALDLSEISKYSTPQALMRRLQKARVACGLPEKLV